MPSKKTAAPVTINAPPYGALLLLKDTRSTTNITSDDPNIAKAPP